MSFLLVLILLTGSLGGLVHGQSGCEAIACINEVQVQNIFLRSVDGSALPPPIICDRQHPRSLFALGQCWGRQCGENYGGNPTILNALRTIEDICMGEAQYKLPQAIAQCRIYYPSAQAPELTADLRSQCLGNVYPRNRRNDSPYLLEPRILTEYFSTSVTPALQVDEDSGWGSSKSFPFLADPLMAVDLSGAPAKGALPVDTVNRDYRPIVGTGVSENWDDSNWKWPAAATSPIFPLVFPQSTLPFTTGSGAAVGTGGSGITQMDQQSLTMCLQVSDLMDCTLARTCGPDLGQVMKSLAMVYLGCSAVVRTSAVCDVDRVRYCMRVNGGNMFDVFDPTRFSAYCQNYRAILSCIDKDCPSNAAGNADLRLLEQYKSFLSKFCVDIAYQTTVVRASANCPIFQNAQVFPATGASMSCAQQLMQRQPVPPDANLCTIVEANTYCLGQIRQCVYADINPQKTALLEMIGCKPTGVLVNGEPSLLYSQRED
ncbi:hypothetical protein BV898_03959 [Hypsibius exemplaris]|uniref:Uncharacterized protein n=1 Tax=Hypsibius exemplaris TaxID=2072580 RepID=A0A1W0X462_HYPEX|nr:hypothetical protein BV898_03959 [Hypsibius exemplaris]